jgi:hypothetical protein
MEEDNDENPFAAQVAYDHVTVYPKSWQPTTNRAAFEIAVVLI